MRKSMQLLAEARLEERLANARWQDTLNRVQGRATPSGLAGDAWDGVQQAANAFTDKVKETAKKRPGTIAVLGAAAALFLLRKVIASTLKSKISQRRETKAASYPLNQKDEPIITLEPMLAPAPTITEEVE